MAQKVGKLYLNEVNRLAIDRWTEFHCGDVVSLHLNGTWVETRIEMNGRGEWYAVGLAGLRLEGVIAGVTV